MWRRQRPPRRPPCRARTGGSRCWPSTRSRRRASRCSAWRRSVSWANGLSIAVLAQRTMKTQISALLITLAVFDILFLLCTVPVFTVQSVQHFVYYLNTCVYKDHGGEWDVIWFMAGGDRSSLRATAPFRDDGVVESCKLLIRLSSPTPTLQPALRIWHRGGPFFTDLLSVAYDGSSCCCMPRPPAPVVTEGTLHARRLDSSQQCMHASERNATVGPFKL